MSCTYCMYTNTIARTFANKHIHVCICSDAFAHIYTHFCEHLLNMNYYSTSVKASEQLSDLEVFLVLLHKRTAFHPSVRLFEHLSLCITNRSRYSVHIWHMPRSCAPLLGIFMVFTFNHDRFYHEHQSLLPPLVKILLLVFIR